MNLQVERLVRIARTLALELAPGREVIFDGPLNSIRVWGDRASGATLHQCKGYWPPAEIADKTDLQLRELLQSWPWRAQDVSSAN